MRYQAKYMLSKLKILKSYIVLEKDIDIWLLYWRLNYWPQSKYGSNYVIILSNEGKGQKLEIWSFLKQLNDENYEDES